MEKRCPHCGAANPDDNRFCQSCGRPFAASASQPWSGQGDDAAPAIPAERPAIQSTHAETATRTSQLPLGVIAGGLIVGLVLFAACGIMVVIAFGMASGDSAA